MIRHELAIQTLKPEMIQHAPETMRETKEEQSAGVFGEFWIQAKTKQNISPIPTFCKSDRNFIIAKVHKGSRQKDSLHCTLNTLSSIKNHKD